MLQKNALYEKLSKERKELQDKGDLPQWVTTMGWQMLKNKNYLYKTNSLKTTFERVAKTCAKHLTHNKDYYEKRFYELLWNGHLALSTPAYNLGTPKGFPVSCTGNVIDDSVFGFFDSLEEVANLTKECFGTSSYIGGIRPRGSKISRGGTANGAILPFKLNVDTVSVITQGQCFLKDSVDVLTDSGFMTFTQAREKDAKLASFNNKSIVYHKPLEYIEKKYTGKMAIVSNDKIDEMHMTPNHDLFGIIIPRDSSYTKISVDEFANQSENIFIMSKEADKAVDSNVIGTGFKLSPSDISFYDTDDSIVECATMPLGNLIIKPLGSDMVYVMGNSRRGAWAGYIDLMHDDFDEVIDEVMADPYSHNIGINYTDEDLIKLSNKHPEVERRYSKHMKLRGISGMGYFYFVDRVHRLQPPMYNEHGLKSKASNLCSEITLHADKNTSFTCVLSAMNLAKFDEWVNSDAVFVATVFLDCVVSEMLSLIDKKPERERHVFDKIKRGTEKSRALGLGVMGFHTYLQENMIPLESMEAIEVNDKIFKHLHDESLKASQYLAKTYGEPEWCVGHGVRNTHRTCIPPTMSSSIICGSVSQGIEPIMSNTYQQELAGGIVTRISPTLLKIMKDRNVLSEELIVDIGTNHAGSVQHVDWLTDIEKQVFKTAYEIDQNVLIDLAADRHKKGYICQAQSLNLFFDKDAEPSYINSVHLNAIFNPYIKSLYYMRTQPVSKASDGKSQVKECESCGV